MSYKPLGYKYLANAHEAINARISARYLRLLTGNYTNEQAWVRNARAAAKKQDEKAKGLESKIKR